MAKNGKKNDGSAVSKRDVPCRRRDETDGFSETRGNPLRRAVPAKRTAEEDILRGGPTSANAACAFGALSRKTRPTAP